MPVSTTSSLNFNFKGANESLTIDTSGGNPVPAGGLTFKSWDTADLAAQLKRLLTDDALHEQLSANSRAVAANFSVGRMADRVLEHMGLPLLDGESSSGR